MQTQAMRATASHCDFAPLWGAVVLRSNSAGGAGKGKEAMRSQGRGRVRRGPGVGCGEQLAVGMMMMGVSQHTTTPHSRPLSAMGPCAASLRLSRWERAAWVEIV